MGTLLRLCLPVLTVGAISCSPGGIGDESADDADMIECAIGGEQAFLRECSVEQVRQEDGALVLVVRHADGGFRRFLVLTDGRGLEPADGAEQAISEVVDGRLDMQVGPDRYRFPATIKGNDAAQ